MNDQLHSPCELPLCKDQNSLCKCTGGNTLQLYPWLSVAWHTCVESVGLIAAWKIVSILFDIMLGTIGSPSSLGQNKRAAMKIYDIVSRDGELHLLAR